MWQTLVKSQLEQPFIFQKPFSSLLPESLNEVGEEPFTVKTCSYFSSTSLEWMFCCSEQSQRKQEGIWLCRLPEVVPSQSSKLDEKKKPTNEEQICRTIYMQITKPTLCIGMINAMTKDTVETKTILLCIIYSLYHLKCCRTDSSFLGSRERAFPAGRDSTV